MENSCRNIKFSPIKSADHSGWLPASAFLTTKEKGGSGLGNISRIAASYAGVVNSGMKNLFSQRGSACRAENRTKKAEAAEKFEEGCGGEGT